MLLIYDHIITKRLHIMYKDRSLSKEARHVSFDICTMSYNFQIQFSRAVTRSNDQCLITNEKLNPIYYFHVQNTLL